MYLKETKGWIRNALIGYAVFLAFAYVLKIFFIKFFGFGEYSFFGSSWGFYHLTILFCGAIFSSLFLINYKFTAIMSMCSYFLGLSLHAIFQAIRPNSNMLLSSEGLYQRIILSTTIFIVSIILEITYKSLKRKKYEIEKEEILNKKIKNLENLQN